MVTKLNTDCNSNSSSVANVVKFSFAWIATLVTSKIQYLEGRMIRCWQNVLCTTFFAIFILVAGMSFDLLHAQGTDPVITIERNPYLLHSSTDKSEYIFVSDKDTTADITINYEVVTSGGGNAISKMVTMATGEHETRGAVSEDHTMVRLLDGTGYNVGSTKTALYIEPTEVPDGKYGLQIVLNKATVVEGETARITQRITPPLRAAPSGQPTVRVDYNDFYRNLGTGIFPMTNPVPISLEWAITSVDKEYDSATIDFADNDTPGDSKNLTFQVDGNTTVWVDFNNANPTIRIIDNDGKPQASIVSSKTVVTEGDSFDLTISSFPKPRSGSTLTINYTRSNSVYTSHGGTSVNLTNTASSQTITIRTLDRTQTDGDDEITFTLSDGGQNYDLVENQNVARILVIDKQAPRPRISANNNSVNIVDEGASEGITFNIQSDSDVPTGGFTVFYEISETGNLVNDDSKGPNTVTIPSGRSVTVPVELNAVDNTAFAHDSIVTIKILPDENLPKVYLPVSSETTASVLVTDLGTERPTDGIFIQRISGTAITEGSDIIFQVGAPSAISTDRIIKINYGGLSTDNFLTSVPNSLITIPANLTSVNVSVSTSDDSNFDASGDFEISIAPAEPPQTTNYLISATKKSIKFKIDDDDFENLTLTGFSIHAVTSTVTNETVARFQLVAPDKLSTAHTFFVTVTQGANESILNLMQAKANCQWSQINNRVQCAIGISANSQSTNFEVTLNDNMIDEGNRTITATIDHISVPAMEQDHAYMLSTTNKSVMVTIMDDDAPPVLKLEAPSNVTNNSFSETDGNEELRFLAKIKQDSSKGITTTASASAITVRYSVTQDIGNFLVDGDVGPNRTVDIVAFGSEVTLLLNVRGNNIDERDGSFTISLVPDLESNNPKTYVVSEVAEERSITIDVKDDEVPLISVRAPNVREGDGIIATVNSDIIPWRDLTVYLCIRDAESSSMCPDSVPNEDGRGDVLAMDLPDSIILPSDGSSVNPGIPLNIETTDDDVIEPGLGQVEIFVYVKNAETDGYRIDEGGTNSGTTVIVQDRDPEISIEAVGGSSVNEGDPAKFRITSNNTVEDGSTLTVYIDITQRGNFLDVTATHTADDPAIPIVVTPTATPPTATLSVSIAAGNNSAVFSIKTNEDMTARPSGIITATIANPAAPQAYYRDTNYSTSIFVNDENNELPEISIEAVSVADGQSVPVRENDTVRFRLNSNREITEPMEVRLCISDGNTHSTNEGCTNTLRGGIVREYLTDTILQFVTMPPSQTNQSVEFEVELDDDANIEDPGQIAVTVLPSTSTVSNYLVHAQNWAIVQVDSNDPTLSIAYSGTGNSINEDEMAMFTITSNVAYTTRNLTVFLEVTQSGEFLDRGQSRFPSVTINSGQTMAMVPIEFFDDDIEEPFGSIEVTLLPDRNNLYFVDETAKSAFVFVRDNDDGLQLPTISISTAKGTVNEGEDAVFVITATPSLPMGTSLSVQTVITEGDPEYILGSPGVGSHPVKLRPTISGTTSELVIKTRSDNEDQPHGSIIVTIQPDPENYEIESTGSESVFVLDDDGEESIRRIN